MSLPFAFWKSSIVASAVALFVNTKSLALDGVNQYVKFSDTTGFPEIAGMTISCWFFNNGDDGVDRYIWGGITSNNRYVYCRQINTNQILVALRNGDIAGIANYLNTIPLNAWTHLAVTWESDGIGNLFEQKVYKNGVLEGTDSDTSFTPSNANFFPSVFAIGEYENATTGPSGTPFDAPIDQVVLWNVVLSESEIKELVQLRDIEDHSQYAEVTNWYEFEDDDIVGTTLTDKAGTEDGTLINGATNINCIPYPYPYQLEENNYTPFQNTNGGFSWDFDGVNDYINYPTSPFLAANPFTIIVWMNLTTIRNEWGIYKEDEFELRGDNSTRFFFRAYDTDGSNYIEVSHNLDTPPLRTWMQIAITCDGSNLKLYTNTELWSQSQSSVGTYIQMRDTGNPLNLGKLSAGFKALSGDFQIYDKELSLAELQNNYNKHQTRNEMNESLAGNLLLYSRAYNSYTGTDGVVDISGNGYHGTMVNMTDTDVVYDFPRTMSDLQSGTEGTFFFDNSSDRVEIPNSADLTFTDGAGNDEPFSITFSLNIGKAGNLGSVRNSKIIWKDGEFEISGNNSGQIFIRLFTDASNYIDVKFVGEMTFSHLVINPPTTITISYNGDYATDGIDAFTGTVNGSVATSKILAETGTYAGMQDSGNDIWLGYAGEYNMCKVSFHNEVMSNCKVGELHNDGSPIDILDFTGLANVISHYRMNQTDDPTTIVTDVVGTNDGIPTNMVAGDLETGVYPTN